MSTYHVATTGNDSTGVGTYASPFRTIAKGLSVLADGDTLYIRQGTYSGEYGNLVCSKNRVTIAGYDDKFAIIDGGFNAYVGATGATYSSALDITGNDVTVQYIRVQNSSGYGIRGIQAARLTISHCESFDSMRHGILVLGANQENLTPGPHVITYCKSIRANLITTGGALIGRYVDGMTISYCECAWGRGEGIACPNSKNVTIKNNLSYNTKKVNIYVDNIENLTVENNTCFYTNDFLAANVPGENIDVTTEWYDIHPFTTANVTIRNNLFIGGYYNIFVHMGKAAYTDGTSIVVPHAKFYNIDIVNNTVINAVKDNIYIHDHGQNLNISSTADGVTWPASSGNVVANNIVIQDGTYLPVKFTDVARTGSSWTMVNNLYSKALGTAYATKETGEVIDSSLKGKLVDYDYVLANVGSFNVENYKLQSGSDAIDAASATHAPATDFFGSSRPVGAADDIGFHEYGGAGADLIMVAAYTTDPAATVQRGATITFEDDSTLTGTSITSRLWYFEGGTTADLTAAAPVVTYSTVGVFAVTYTIYDSTNSKSSTVSGSVTITETSSSTAAPLESAVVAFAGGDTTIAHTLSVTPSAAIFVYGSATADDTSTANANMSTGFWTASGQMVSYTRNTSGETSKQGWNGYFSGGVAWDDSDNSYATVDSIDGTNANLTWASGPSAFKGFVIFLGGTGITATALDQYAWASTDTTPTAKSKGSGTYNLLIAALGYSGGAAWNAQSSLGFAVSGVGQAGVGTADRRGDTYAEIHAQTSYLNTHEQTRSTYEASFSSGYTITRTMSGSAAASWLTVLALNISGVAMSTGLADTPINTSATDYTLTFDPGTIIAAVSNATGTGRTSGDAYFGVYATDGTAQRTVGISQKSATLPTVTSNYTDDKFSVRDGGDGTALVQASAALGTNKFTITATTADATARKFAWLAIEDVASSGGPTAAFTFTWDGYVPFLYDQPSTADTLIFTNLSVAGAEVITGYAWDFGDGDTSTDQNPTHLFALPGNYNVVLTVTDDGALTDDYTYPILVTQGPPAYTATLDVSNGAAPLTVEIDWSATTWGDLTIDWDRSAVGVWSSTAALYTQSNPLLVYGFDGVAEVTLSEPGQYHIGFHVHSTTGVVNTKNLWSVADENFAYWEAITVRDAANVSVAYAPNILAFVGPLEVTFSLAGVKEGLDGSTVDWDYGDGDSDLGIGHVTTHEYAAVTTLTAYTVTVDILYPDETTEQIVLTDAVRVFPAPIPPVPLQTIATNWSVYQAHAGDLTGQTWVQEDAPNASVWAVSLSYDWASNITPRLFEDGTELTARASVALCQANAGSYYATNTAGDMVIYVHATASGNPNTNGKVYRWKD